MALNASTQKPAQSALLIRKKECIASSLRKKTRARRPDLARKSGAGRRPIRPNDLEVHLDPEPHAAGVTGEVVNPTDRVVQGVRRAALLGLVVQTVAVSEALFRPD